LPYGGLCLEIKAHEKSKISESQWDCIERLNKNGYLAAITIGLDETIAAVEGYLKFPFGTIKWERYLNSLRMKR